VRGALNKVEGVGNIAITQGNRDFTVAFDPKKVKVADLLAALEKAGEPAPRPSAAERRQRGTSTRAHRQTVRRRRRARRRSG
jgi:allophanate hydrolase subunit 1